MKGAIYIISLFYSRSKFPFDPFQMYQATILIILARGKMEIAAQDIWRPSERKKNSYVEEG